MSDISETLIYLSKSSLVKEIERLRSELSTARNSALEEAAKVIEEGYDRPGIYRKQDTCGHGKFGWEDCDECAAVAVRALKAEGESR